MDLQIAWWRLRRTHGIRICRRGVLAACLLLVLSRGAGAQERKPGKKSGEKPATGLQHDLVSDIPCPDPYVFHDGADWYVYGTGAKPFFLQGKELAAGSMTRHDLEIDYAGANLPVQQIWGFIVYRHRDGSYYAYGTLHLGQFRTVIACFVPLPGERWEPGRPIVRWKFQRLLVGDPARQDWKYYESKIVSDGDGPLYLVYVSSIGRDNAIVARRLISPVEIDPAAQPQTLLAPEGFRSEDRDDAKGMQIVEGASIIKVQNTFILLYSAGDFLLGNYKLGVAYSDRLIPEPGRTYRKVRMPNPAATGQPTEIGYVLQSQRADWPNYCGRFVVGPGLGSVVTIDDKPWLVFHGYKPFDREHNPANRFVFRLPLTIAIRKGEPALNWLHARLPTETELVHRRTQERARLLERYNALLKPGSVWEGVSDWGQERRTKSELHLLKAARGRAEFEFVFLEASIFNTPVPFREAWFGEIVNNDSDGIYLKLVRHDGKATHIYTLNDQDVLAGKPTNAAFRYYFRLRDAGAGK
jgi:hypothetical protein